MNKGAIVLFSGGIDSTTALHWALKRFDPLWALVFDYGQLHRIEVEMAKRIAYGLGVGCEVLKLPLAGLLGSALLGDERPIASTLAESRREPGPPSTYVPFRNGIFLALAAANTVVQHLIHDDKRARVMSIYTMAFMGATPIGSFLVGILASAVGVRWTIAAGGALSILGVLVFARKFLPLSQGSQ